MSLIKKVILYILVCLPFRQGNAQPVQTMQNGQLPEHALSLSVETLKDMYPALSQKDTQVIIKQINHAITITMSNADSSRRLLTEALQKSLYLKYYTGIAAALTNLANAQSASGNYERSLEYYRMALPFARKAFHNRTSMGMFYSAMSGPYYYLARYDSMYYYSSKAMKLVEGIRCRSSGEAMDVSSIYNNAGMLWGQMGNLSRAKQYVDKALRILQPFKDTPLLANSLSMIYNNRAGMYFDDKKYDSAVILNELALKYTRYNPAALINLAKIADQRQDRAKAISLLKEAIDMTQKSNSYQYNLNAKAILGKIYFDDRQYQKAQALLTEAIASAVNKGEIDAYYSYYAHHNLSAIRAMQGNYREAYTLERESVALLDSIKTREKLLSVYDLEYQYRTAEKDKQIARNQLQLHTAENKLRERNMWTGVAIAFSILVLVALFFFYRNSRNKQRLQRKEMDAIQQQQEIGNLKSMIRGEEQERRRIARELHDGIMVQLATVRMKMQTLPEEKGDVTAAYRQMISQMDDATRELRKTAHNLMPDFLLQGGLSEALAYFCNTLQQNSGLAISFQVVGELWPLRQDFSLSVYRIVQELLQNIIKHAHATTVLVQLAYLDDHLFTLTVEDNGSGFDPEDPATTGMGWTSIRSRVEALQGIIDLDSGPGKGTSVHISFDHVSSLSS